MLWIFFKAGTLLATNPAIEITAIGVEILKASNAQTANNVNATSIPTKVNANNIATGTVTIKPINPYNKDGTIPLASKFSTLLENLGAINNIIPNTARINITELIKENK